MRKDKDNLNIENNLNRKSVLWYAFNSIWLLGFLCIFQKIVNIIFKCFFVCFCIVVFNLFAVFNRTATKRHVMIIALCINLSACGTAIAEPITIEAFTEIPRNESLELCNRGLKIRECLPQYVVNGERIFWPIGRDGIKPLEFAQKNISEFFGGSSETISPTIKLNEVSSDCSHNESPRYLWDMSHCEIDQFLHDFNVGMWYGLIAVFIMIYFKLT